jgi:hypothetical protein
MPEKPLCLCFITRTEYRMSDELWRRFIIEYRDWICVIVMLTDIGRGGMMRNTDFQLPPCPCVINLSRRLNFKLMALLLHTARGVSTLTLCVIAKACAQ